MSRGLAAVLAVSALLAIPAAASAAETPKPFRFGLNDQPDSHSDGARALALHTGLGATVQRLGLPWRLVQPQPGGYDWGYSDRVYRIARSRDMAPIFVVSSTPAWAATNTYVRQCFLNENGQFCQRPPAPEHLADFGDFLAAVARRYPKLAAIELFNEPNLGNFNWQPDADPEGYARVLRAGRDAVKRVRPALPVITGGVTFPPAPLERGMLDPGEFLERMLAAAGRGAADGISVHLYPGRLGPDDPTSAAAKLLGVARVIRDRNGDSALPVWVTETGYATGGEEGLSLDMQADWLPRLVDRLLRERDVAAVVVNTLADRDGEFYGVAFSDLRVKPVYERLRAVAARIVTERTAKACKCTKRAKRCARARSTTKSCRKGRRRCRCIRRWRRCVKRGSNNRRCRRARRCARCKPVAAGAACAPAPVWRE